MCVPKGGRGCYRPIYGRPKLTLVSQKKILSEMEVAPRYNF